MEHGETKCVLERQCFEGRWQLVLVLFQCADTAHDSLQPIITADVSGALISMIIGLTVLDEWHPQLIHYFRQLTHTF